ncbi:hypothetical protein [uncultured Aquimarina sp.]|uniref:hypothetical protein n=1 Tax=uncultured Aquimarina sp. TaxID=575652 RepID=UPI00260EF006|nr:hypothetical protein [uncultured Aquimarina sp.]
MIIQIQLLLILLTPFGISTSQKIIQLEGVYQGHVQEGYSFCYKTITGFEETIVFNEILSVILEKHPLNTDKLIGEHFIISFVNNVIIEKKRKKVVSTILRLQKPVTEQYLRK